MDLSVFHGKLQASRETIRQDDVDPDSMTYEVGFIVKLPFSSWCFFILDIFFPNPPRHHKLQNLFFSAM